jgi:acetyl-CoA carboxylase biotin carboxyl carrier protein
MTVGTWVPEIAPGTVISERLRLGRLRQAGRWLPVLAPKVALGRTVSSIEKGPLNVGCGTALLALGEAPTLSAPRVSAGGVDADLVPITVGMTGALYRRPTPDQPAFAPEGSLVEQHGVVALIEVMKTYNPIKAPRAGKIIRWLVADGETVEPGTVILLLRPV